MKFLSRVCPEIFKSRPGQALLLVNLLACGFAVDREKVFSYLDALNTDHCKPVAAGISFSEVSFSFSCYHSITSDEVLAGFFELASFPARVGTELFISDLKRNFPLWCPETFEFLEVIVFIIFSSLLWLAAGGLIESFYGRRRGGDSDHGKMISIIRG